MFTKTALSGVVIFCFLFTSACSTPPVNQSLTPPINPTSSPNQAVWTPKAGETFQIQFSGAIDLTIDADIFDLDAFDTEASTVQQLHQSGKHVICYINAGAVEDWRPDAALYPASVVGNEYQGWPGEKWLDIRELEALSGILEARLDLCQSKGFDGVEFDNVDGYQNDAGFSLTASDQLTFNRWLADAAHQHGLAVGLKNDPEQVKDLEAWFDFLIFESCFTQGWCDKAQPFIDAGKPVFVVEYVPIDQYCSTARDMPVQLIQKHLDLDAWARNCE